MVDGYFCARYCFSGDIWSFLAILIRFFCLTQIFLGFWKAIRVLESHRDISWDEKNYKRRLVFLKGLHVGVNLGSSGFDQAHKAEYLVLTNMINMVCCCLTFFCWYFC